MFGRRKKRAETARRALFQRDFPSETAPGVTGLVVDYDPALWVRCPSLGQDRTQWHDDVLAAFAQDLEWPADDVRRKALSDALDEVANDPLAHTANFMLVPAELDESPVIAYVDVADEELNLLERGEPDQFLTFADVDPSYGGKVRTFPQGWRWNSHIGTEPGGAMLIHLRAHKTIDVSPPVHVVGVGFASKGTRSGDLLSLFADVRVLLDDGREL
jgi:hypothetical protein